jgi:hypothetical protein
LALKQPDSSSMLQNVSNLVKFILPYRTKFLAGLLRQGDGSRSGEVGGHSTELGRNRGGTAATPVSPGPIAHTGWRPGLYQEPVAMGTPGTRPDHPGSIGILCESPPGRVGQWNSL